MRVHCGENRRHLQRSLKAGRARARSRRLIAVASARDLFEPESWVRCLVVNADTLQLPADDPGHAVLRSAEPSQSDGPLAYRSRQQDVPEDAVWLVVPTSNYRSPSVWWGKMCESHHQQTNVAVGAVPQGCDDIDNEDYVRRWVRSYRMATVGLWVMLGPVTWLLVWLFGMLAALPETGPHHGRHLRDGSGCSCHRLCRGRVRGAGEAGRGDWQGHILALPREPGTQKRSASSRLDGRNRRVPYRG